MVVKQARAAAAVSDKETKGSGVEIRQDLTLLK